MAGDAEPWAESVWIDNPFSNPSVSQLSRYSISDSSLLDGVIYFPK